MGAIPLKAQASGSVRALAALAALLTFFSADAFSDNRFAGKFYRGRGDVDYLQLLDEARRMFEPDPEFQNLSMLYEPKWNGLVEGPTWDAWWIQNSYGTTYGILPFLQEPFTTFLQHSQDLWFDQMGDGKHVGAPPPFDWVAPEGCLCDAARPGWIVYKQGDGRTAIHDWGMEFTAAGLLLQSELLLISREATARAHYLPRLERCAEFIETRRDPANDLFLAGPAGNLLAPSYAAWRKPDGSYGKAYLAGLSITYIAALDRLIELETLAKNVEKISRFRTRRASAKSALSRLTTGEGYFIRSLDPDGTRHGVFGAPRFGYFESSPNHDAIAFRVIEDPQAERIYQKIASVPQLRPFDFILPNYPSYDDMYEKAEGLWAYGTWVNGGHWSTCEARMILAYYRLSKFEDARKSLRRLLTFAERFRMDNPLTKCGSDVYQPNQPINLCYDSFGPAAAFLRGLCEYLYSADALTLVPHIPPSVVQLEQLQPVRFGPKKVFLATVGTGPIRAVKVNRRPWRTFDSKTVTLTYDKLPEVAQVEILLGSSENQGKDSKFSFGQPQLPASGKFSPEPHTPADPRLQKLRTFERKLTARGLQETYEAAHARLAIRGMETAHQRNEMLRSGLLKQLPEPARTAANKCYIDTAAKIYAGLEAVIKSYGVSNDRTQKIIYTLWNEAAER